jgi:hypothetical protein
MVTVLRGQMAIIIRSYGMPVVGKMRVALTSLRNGSPRVFTIISASPL